MIHEQQCDCGICRKRTSQENEARSDLVKKLTGDMSDLIQRTADTYSEVLRIEDVAMAITATLSAANAYNLKLVKESFGSQIAEIVRQNAIQSLKDA